MRAILTITAAVAACVPTLPPSEATTGNEPGTTGEPEPGSTGTGASDTGQADTTAGPGSGSTGQGSTGDTSGTTGPGCEPTPHGCRCAGEQADPAACGCTVELAGCLCVDVLYPHPWCSWEPCQISGDECLCDGAPAEPEACGPCVYDGRICLCPDGPAPNAWCEVPDCMLPTGPSWCWGALSASQAGPGCSGEAEEDQSACYATVAAQYFAGDPVVLQAADCDTNVPGCLEDRDACLTAPGALACSLLHGDTAEDCTGRAVADGVIEAQAAPYCAHLVATYGP